MSFYNTRRKKTNRNKISNLMIFLLVFVVFLIVFGGICFWAVIKINEERRAAGSSSTVSISNEVNFDKTDGRNLLIVTTDRGQAQGFVAVRSDPAKSRIRTLAIPRSTVVDYKTSEIRLYDLVDKQGVSIAKDALTTLIGLKFDNYIMISYENIEKLIEHFEAGVIMTLNEDLNYRDKDLSINIEGGLRTLSADQAVNVLRYPAWHGGLKQRADIQAELTAALINQYMRSSRNEQSNQDFSAMVNLANKTDILVSHFTKAKTGLDYLAERNKGSLCTAFSLPGGYQGSGEAIRYYAADNVKESIESTFG